MQRLQFYKSKSKVFLAGIALVMFCVMSVASSALAEIGDPAAGKVRAAVCTACHGPDGISVNDNWPNLAGQKENYIIEQLESFQKGTRTNPLMSGVAKMLTQKDIHDVAAYFSHLKPCN